MAMDILEIRELPGLVPYSGALALQERLHEQRRAGEIPDTLLLLEHRPVYTLGSSADASHILMDGGQLAAAGIERVQTNRGGDVTYHGPGQLVGYPIIHLGERGIKVVEYVTAIEETIIRAVAEFGIAANRDERNRGVWVGDSKLCALGIRVSRQVAMHGFALNVNTRLEDFGGIIPCGISNAGVTSMAKLLGAPPPMAAVKQAVIRQFKAVLNYSLPTNP
ncbi:MAG: lipoyl(octanoyl) transferase LipB [Kiritimatiellae bacterium]|nr:lipoyl(octanoyl) transferase LipB [Kiritimatiellia bacterium]